MFNSVLPLIDTWLITDTGSVDGTQELIQAKLGHLPGKLVETTWENFGANRNKDTQ